MSRFKPRNIFEGTIGLNNRVDPVRAPYDYRSNLRAVTQANDCMSDDAGRIGRVPGYVKKLTGQFHSLYPAGEYTYCVRDGYISRIAADYSVETITAVDPLRRVAFERVSLGINEDVYWSNGEISGIIRDGVNRSWDQTPYIGADQTSRHFSDPPAGHLLAYWSGRMLVAKDHTVFYSEPYSLGCFDLNANRLQFKGRVRILCGVDGGIWIGDGAALYFLDGSIAPAGGALPRPQVKDTHPPLEGCATPVDMAEFEGTTTGRGWLVGTTAGICLMGPGGTYRNLTAESIEFRDDDNKPIQAERGSAFSFGGRSFFSIW
jgi:hypothetical protein